MHKKRLTNNNKKKKLWQKTTFCETRTKDPLLNCVNLWATEVFITSIEIDRVINRSEKL